MRRGGEPARRALSSASSNTAAESSPMAASALPYTVSMLRDAPFSESASRAVRTARAATAAASTN